MDTRTLELEKCRKALMSLGIPLDRLTIRQIHQLLQNDKQAFNIDHVIEVFVERKYFSLSQYRNIRIKLKKQVSFLNAWKFNEIDIDVAKKKINKGAFANKYDSPLVEYIKNPSQWCNTKEKSEVEKLLDSIGNNYFHLTFGVFRKILLSGLNDIEFLENHLRLEKNYFSSIFSPRNCAIFWSKFGIINIVDIWNPNPMIDVNSITIKNRLLKDLVFEFHLASELQQKKRTLGTEVINKSTQMMVSKTNFFVVTSTKTETNKDNADLLLDSLSNFDPDLLPPEFFGSPIVANGANTTKNSAPELKKSKTS